MRTLIDYSSPSGLESFSITGTGINFNDQQLSQIKARLRKLEARSPAYSEINLDFKNKIGCIRGELRIASAGKKFMARAQGYNILMIYNQLETEIDKKLIQWKKNRFSQKGQRLTGGYTL